jgi:predicted metal-dependent hydrolase
MTHYVLAGSFTRSSRTMWGRRKKQSRGRRRTRAITTQVRQHYEEHKEFARGIIHERISYWNRQYNFEYRRIAIRNQRTCWGSCSLKQNLNFNYKIVFLPQHLMDYIIVHELCHLAELNHSKSFWSHVSKAIPDYREKRKHLRKMTHVPLRGFPSSVAYSRVRGES